MSLSQILVKSEPFSLNMVLRMFMRKNKNFDKKEIV